MLLSNLSLQAEETNTIYFHPDKKQISQSLMYVRQGMFTGFALSQNDQKVNISAWKRSTTFSFSKSTLSRDEFAIYKNRKRAADITGIISGSLFGYFLYDTLFPSDSYNNFHYIALTVGIPCFITSGLLYAASIPHLLKSVENNNRYWLNGGDSFFEAVKQKKASSFSKKWLFSLSGHMIFFAPENLSQKIISSNGSISECNNKNNQYSYSSGISPGFSIQKNMHSVSIGAELIYSLKHSYESEYNDNYMENGTNKFNIVKYSGYRQLIYFEPYIRKYFSFFYISAGCGIAWLNYETSEETRYVNKKKSSVSNSYIGFQMLPCADIGIILFKNQLIKLGLDFKLFGNNLIYANGHSGSDISLSIGY